MTNTDPRDTNAPNSQAAKPEPSLVHLHPQILLIDMSEEVANALGSKGYNISTGSFGRPFKIQQTHVLLPLSVKSDLLPHSYAESEIVIADLAPSQASGSMPNMDEHWVSDTRKILKNSNDPIVDPRPYFMRYTQRNFARIFAHGGLFIIFADFPSVLKLSDMAGNPSDICTSWDFLPQLSNLAHNEDIQLETGQAIGLEYVVKDSFFTKHFKDATYNCVFRVSEDSGWFVLARNKFGQPVSMALKANTNIPDNAKGIIYILPRLSKPLDLLVEMLESILPDVAPALFPHVEAGRWAQAIEYEIPKILELKCSIEQVRKEAEEKTASLEQEIERERSEWGYLHNLLTGTSDTLVKAVKKALETIGFQDVVDVDEEKKAAGDTGERREDLWIRDKGHSPLILGEAKGISGLPSEEEALTVIKYINPRMRELKTTEIRGLTIINHERHKRALARASEPFQPDVIVTADKQEITLMTSWDLFRLVRSYLKNSWIHEHIRPLFYKNGRFELLPTNYEYIGFVDRYLEKNGLRVVGIQIEAEGLKHSDRIAFELEVEFEEQIVDSLHIDNENVEEASIGKLAGVLTHLTKHQARMKTRVFRVNSTKFPN